VHGVVLLYYNSYIVGVTLLEDFMNNVLRFLLIIAFITAIGFSMTGCEDPTEPPDRPEAFYAQATSATSIQVYWFWTSGTIKIYRSLSSTGPFTLVGDTSKETFISNKFIDSGLTANTTYYYYMTSSNIIGESEPSEVFSARTTNTPITTLSLNTWHVGSLPGEEIVKIIENPNPYLANNLIYKTQHLKIPLTGGMNTWYKVEWVHAGNRPNEDFIYIYVNVFIESTGLPIKVDRSEEQLTFYVPFLETDTYLISVEKWNHDDLSKYELRISPRD